MSALRMLLACFVVVLLFGNLASAQDDTPRPGRARRAQQQDQQNRPRPGRRPASPVIAALDANGDGEISAEEIANAVAALKKLDQNSDGKLTRDEFAPPRQGRFGGAGGGFGGNFADRLFQGDDNNDGKLSKEELPERMQARFARIDADGDGFLTRKEVEDSLGRFRRGRGGPGGGQGDQPRRPE